MKMAKELVKNKELEIELRKLIDGEGDGFEGYDENVVPFLKVAQAMTPEVQDGEARPGNLINTATSEVYTDGITFLPCFQHTVYVEWTNRDRGSELVGRHQKGSPVVTDAIADNDGQDFGKMRVPTEERDVYNDLVKTAYVYGLILDDTDCVTPMGGVILSFNSTKMRPFRRWMTNIKGIVPRPQLFLTRARITTVEERHKDYKYHNFKISPLEGTNYRNSLLNPETDGATIQAAIEFRKAVMDGNVLVGNE